MMKKLLIFFTLALLSTTYVSAQSLSLTTLEGKVIPDTATVLVDASNVDATIFYANVNNISENIINVICVRTNVDIIEGTGNSFCFAAQCYPPFLDTSAVYLPIPAGGSSPDEDFKGEFTAYENLGISIVKYKFYDFANPDDFVEVVVNYLSSPTAIEEDIAQSVNFSNAYPNPALNTVNIDYSFDIRVDAASVKIVNLLGSVVKEVEMDQNGNRLRIDVSDLTAGVYFYSVVVNNEIFQTKKLVIR